MSEDANARCANQPQNSADGRRPDTERNSNNQKTSVQLRRSSASEPNVEIGTLKLGDTEHAANNEYNDEKQEQVCEQAVNAEHNEDDGIVAAEVGQVVVDASLDLAEVLRLGETLEVEEFADGLQVGETAAEPLRADCIEAAAQVEPAGEGFVGDVHAGHDCRMCERANEGGWWFIEQD